ncbi:SusC/RagA family TonB-linked outer membrane protein [Sphingobacterium spiritivorum]|uniref:SusC/RagA family TonB-linked outer membrane protein n=1 Tax=Sphingobacterium spiritivorum TaxID=258 RepID=UPI003DA641AF
MSKVLMLLTAFCLSIGVSFAQNRQLQGTIKAADSGQTLSGVSIKVLGTNVSTSSDSKGNFKINVPAQGGTLQFSYVGYTTQSVPFKTESTLNISLQTVTNALEEVTVNVGYGVVKKKDLTGAVASVSADVISKAPVASALEAIQGRLSGVNISSTEGSPDAEMTVRVRGGGSITGDNSPLYIVDGFPVTTIADIAPSDIESIDVLKDASSTAIYGSRGANGVIIVTTKTSKTGKFSVSYNAFGGVRNIANTLDVLQPLDYARWQYERALLTRSIDTYTKYFGNFQDIDLYDGVAMNDWQDIVFGRTGNTFNQNVSLSGGSEKTKYSFSHNFIKDKAIMVSSGYNRQNINFKLNHKLHKRVTLDLGFRFSDMKIDGGGANEQNEKSSADSRLKAVMVYPGIPVQGLTDSEETDEGFNLFDPLTFIADNDQLQKRRSYNLNGSIGWEIVDNLRFKTDFTFDDGNNSNDRFYGKTTYYVRNTPEDKNQNLPAVILSKISRQSIRTANTLNYDFKSLLNKDHNLNVLLGQEYIFTKSNALTNTVHGFPSTFTFDQSRKLTAQGTPFSTENFFNANDILLSFFGRANYDFRGKYLLSATFRADGSSKFGPGNKWGYFPSVSGAWRISDEAFMDASKSWLNDLKLRLSYGTAGNNNIPTGQIDPTFTVTPTSWINGYSSFWSTSKIMSNPDLKWETTITRNLGLDFSLFNSRVTGTVEAYLNKTKDLLIDYPIAGVGYDSQYRNMGETQNKGIEVALNWAAVKSKDFDLNVSANISFNRNRVNSLGLLNAINWPSRWASTEIGSDYWVQPGAAVGQMYGYKSAGRYEVSDFTGYDAAKGIWTLKEGVATANDVIGTIRPGSMKLEDLNGDGKINENDKTIIGNANPKHTGGFSINTRYKNFDLTALFNWSFGNDIYNANKIEYTQTSKYHSRNMISIMEEGQRWTNLLPDGTISNDPAQLAAMNANTTLWSPLTKQFIFSDWAVEDGSFLRLGTLTLGYTFSNELLQKVKVKNLRIYGTGYNLFRITNYSGFDPEVSTRRQSALTPGVDYSAYPKSRLYVVGVNLSF